MIIETSGAIPASGQLGKPHASEGERAEELVDEGRRKLPGVPRGVLGSAKVVRLRSALLGATLDRLDAVHQSTLEGRRSRIG